MGYFLKDSGFFEKFPEWEKFESKGKAIPQDILDAIVFTISAGKTQERFKESLRDSLERMEEDVLWLGQAQSFKVPSPEAIKEKLKKNQQPHKLKAAACDLKALRKLLNNTEWRIANYFKEDVFPEINLYRNICARTVEYISAMLPKSLGYDARELREKYMLALDNYLDTLAWKYLGANARYSIDDFVDCWNINGFFYSYMGKHLQREEKDLKLFLSSRIANSLERLNLPHIRLFDCYWEERSYDYDNIVKHYLNLVACDSNNARQIIWAVEGKKVQENIDLFVRQLYLSSIFKKPKSEYHSAIAKPILKAIMDGFSKHFKKMQPGALWLKKTNFWRMSDWDTASDSGFLLKEFYPLAKVESQLLKEKKE